MNRTDILELGVSAKPRLIPTSDGSIAIITAGAAGSAAVFTKVENAPPRNYVPLIVIFGESNAAGSTFNASNYGNATPEEMGTRACVQILHNDTHLFEALNEGSGGNNSTEYGPCYLETSGGHTFGNPQPTSDRMTNIDTRHGVELQIANRVSAGAFKKNDVVYVVKAAHGGSRISFWDPEYPVGDFWQSFVERYNWAKNALLNAEDAKIPLPYVYYSQGINDTSTLGVTALTKAEWKAATIANINRMRAVLGNAPFIMTKFDADALDALVGGSFHKTADINEAIDEIAAELPFIYLIETEGFERQELVTTETPAFADPYHWSYTGLKAVADAFIDICVATVGEHTDYLESLLYATQIGTGPVIAVVPPEDPEDPGDPGPFTYGTDLLGNGDFTENTVVSGLCITSGLYPVTGSAWDTWAASGQVLSYTKATSGAAPTDFSCPAYPGAAVSLNYVNSGDDGVLTQTFATEIGKTYSVRFNFGGLWASPETADVILNLLVEGSTELLSEAVHYAYAGDGCHWKSTRDEFFFTADSTSTDITFSAGGSGTYSSNRDVLLANTSVCECIPVPEP